MQGKHREIKTQLAATPNDLTMSAICPKCGYSMDKVLSNAARERKPQPGDMALCFNCVAILAFNREFGAPMCERTGTGRLKLRWCGALLKTQRRDRAENRHRDFRCGAGLDSNQQPFPAPATFFRSRLQRENQSGSSGIDRGVKERRQKDAAIRAIEKPRQHESCAEEREKKGGNNWPWKFISNQREMPKRPYRCQNETRNQGRISCLQLRESETAPTGFFAKSDEQENKDKTFRHFAQFFDRQSGRWRREAECDANRDQANQDRCQENDGICLYPDAPAHESAEKFPESRAAGYDGGHDNGSDEWAQWIRPAGAAAHRGNNP